MSALTSFNTKSILLALIVLGVASPAHTIPALSNSDKQLQRNFNPNVFDVVDSTCTLHLIELHSDFPYSNIQQPFRGTKANTWGAFKSSTQDSVFKIQNHNCLIQLVIAPETEPDFYEQTWASLRIILNQPIPYGKTHVYQTSILVVFVLSDLLRGQESTIATTIFMDTLRLRNLPSAEIALLAYQVNESHDVHVDYGLYHCSYCAKSDNNGWYSFQCTQRSICYENIKAAGLEASMDNKGAVWQHRYIQSNIINTLPEFQNINAEIVRATSLGFILESLQLNSTRNIVVNHPDAIPELLSVPKTPFIVRMSHNYYFYPVGRSKGLRFITSDSVTETKEAMTTLAPLTPLCWLALGVSMIVSALVVAIICSTEVQGSQVHVFVITLLWTYRVLTENCHGVTPSTDVRSSLIIHCCKVVLTFWLLMGIVISNAYKCVVKSNFFIPTAYETQWKILEEIKDFSLYTIINSNSSVCTIGTGILTKDDNYTDGRFSSDLQSPVFTEIAYHTALLYGDRIEELTSEANEDLNLIGHILTNMTYVCQTSLDKIIDNELSVVRTATVLVAEDLDKYYKIFFERAGNNPRRPQFSHNNNGDDQFLTRPRAFAISGGARRHQKPVRDRIQALLSSGIYLMWEKWERFNENGRQLADKAQWKAASAKPQALRIENLNVAFIFSVLLVGLCVATVGFVAEKVYKFKDSLFCFSRCHHFFCYPFGAVEVLN